MAHKGPGDAPTFDPAQTSTLRIGILHTRWNTPIVTSLLEGSLRSLTAAGIPNSNITVQSVPGSYELPFAAQRMYTASQTSSVSGGLVSAATDLLGVGTGGAAEAKSEREREREEVEEEGVAAGARGPFDAIIAIGVLIKGSTMHFEYISDAVAHGLMRVQLDTGCPVVFGVLTCLTEEQAYTRAGMKGHSAAEAGGSSAGEGKEGISHGESGHNHGEDWGSAAVEMGLKRRAWGEGKFMH